MNGASNIWVSKSHAWSCLLLVWLGTARGAEVPPDVLWACSAGAGASDESRGLGVAADSLGQAFVCGYFSGSASFGTTNLTSSGYEDIFVAKYDAGGHLLWVRQAGGALYDEARAIATDDAGNAYVAGMFQGNINFGSTNLSSGGPSDAFLAKYSSVGALLWVRKAGGGADDEANGVAVDAAGDAWVTGYFNGVATFGSISLSSLSSSNQLFVAKCRADGTLLWARRAGGSDDMEGMAVAVGTNLNGMVTGHFAGAANFGVTNLTALGSNSTTDIFLAAYDGSGNFLWVRQAGGQGKDEGTAVAVDRSGNAAVTGHFTGTAAFGPTNLSGNGQDIFVAKYGPDGALLWVRKAGGNNSIYGDGGLGIVADDTGKLFAAGFFSGTAPFNGTNLVTSGFLDAFVSCYLPNGDLSWAKQAGGFNIDVGSAVALDNAGNLLLTGFFSGTASFGITNLTSSGGGGGRDVFLARLAARGSPQLTISRIPTGVRLSWPAADSDYRLQVSPAAFNPAWSLWNGPTNIVGTRRVVDWTSPAVQSFFQLVRPRN